MQQYFIDYILTEQFHRIRLCTHITSSLPFSCLQGYKGSFEGKWALCELSCYEKAITVIENSWSKLCLYEFFFFFILDLSLSAYFIFRWLQGTCAINFFLCITLTFPGLAIILLVISYNITARKVNILPFSVHQENPRPEEEKWRVPGQIPGRNHSQKINF